MSYANWKKLIDNQTINAAIGNGAGREVDDCIIGIGSSGDDHAAPFYIDTTLKCYAFSGLCNGYYFAFAANSDLGTGSNGTNYFHAAYIETSDAGVDGRVAGSKSSVDFTLVITTTTAVPSGYDGSVVVGKGEYTAQWDSVTDYNIPVQPVCHRDEIFGASENGLSVDLADQTWEDVHSAGKEFRIPTCLHGYFKVDATVCVYRNTPAGGDP